MCNHYDCTADKGNHKDYCFHSKDFVPFGVPVVAYHATALMGPKYTQEHDTSDSLLTENLLDVAEFFLRLSCYLFGFAFHLQLGIIGDFPCHFPDRTLYFVKRTFHFVLHARFHGFFLSGIDIHLLKTTTQPSRKARQRSCADNKVHRIYRAREDPWIVLVKGFDYTGEYGESACVVN
jgi:hypothetical protein